MAKDNKKKGGFGAYYNGIKTEMKKVVWPTKDDVISSIKVVIISTIVMAVVLGLLDISLSALFRAIMK